MPVVATSTCSACGAALAPDAQFCAYCGTAVIRGSAPLASGGSAPPSFVPGPTTRWGPPAPPPARSRGSRVLRILVVFLVVIVLVGVVAFAFLPTAPASPISVPEFVVYSPDNVCGLSSNAHAPTPIAYDGFNSSTGANVSIGLYVPNFNDSDCTIHRVVTNTTGFSITSITLDGAALPGAVAAYPANGTMFFSVLTPPNSYSGNVDLEFY
jgi:ribosomal protein L40E